MKQPNSAIGLKIYGKCALFLGTMLQTGIMQLYTQELPNKGLHASAGMELVSRYFWRGHLLSKSAAIQPFIEVGHGNFTAGIWGSSTIKPLKWHETNIYLNYEWNSLFISVNDYFVIQPENQSAMFTDLRQETTGHIMELIAGFSGTERVPFRLMAGYNFFGDRTRSVYIEAALMKTFINLDFELFSGYTPHTGYYHDTISGITSTGIVVTRNLYSAKNIAVPMKVYMIYSPIIRRLFMIFSIGVFN